MRFAPKGKQGELPAVSPDTSSVEENEPAEAKGARDHSKRCLFLFQVRAPINIMGIPMGSLQKRSAFKLCPFNTETRSSALRLRKAPLSCVKPHHLPAAGNWCLNVYFPLKTFHFSNKKIFPLILLSLCIFKRNINYTLNSSQQILHILPDSSII